MDKLKLAHDWAMKIIEGNMRAADASDLVERAWQYAEAMQAEADNHISKERPDVLCEVDWSQAPEEYPTTGWYIFEGVAHWIADEFPCGPAPSFGFTGNHIVERPHHMKEGD